MADNPPPKKKSRLREFLSTLKPHKSSYPGQASKTNLSIAVPSSYTAVPRPDAPSTGPSFGQPRNATSQNLHKTAPACPLAPLISPTTAAATAFKSLSVGDHQSGNGGSQESQRNNQNEVYQVPHPPASAQAPTSVGQQHLPPLSSSVAESNGSRSNVNNHNSPALPLPASTYAPPHIRPRVKPTVDLDRIPDAPQLPPPGYKPGIEPVPKHPGTDITNLSQHYYNHHGRRTSSPPKNLYTSPEFEAYQHTPGYRNYIQAQKISSNVNVRILHSSHHQPTFTLAPMIPTSISSKVSSSTPNSAINWLCICPSRTSLPSTPSPKTTTSSSTPVSLRPFSVSPTISLQQHIESFRFAVSPISVVQIQQHVSHIPIRNLQPKVPSARFLHSSG